MPDVDPLQLTVSLMKLARLYGQNFITEIGGTLFIRLCSQDLVHEPAMTSVSKRRWLELFGRFGTSLELVRLPRRHLSSTSSTSATRVRPEAPIRAVEGRWTHKLLMPVFGPLTTQKMFPELLDITSQMLMK
ncbi:hypothetical protein LTR56_010396 [Elasticomyces elasticus]|nr:hypothetical protein LTR22_024403 [Elasticomyces elasticus]KAK3643022.1 hypothetical protein LTR56_010396 [Elasticomyces elasticus]KAK4916821.1 hypothetical protein LTR49_015265 [Elasticomyces elasticus]KAK5755971.1 hypothetical protein LTS12_013975 [Elasticomyces elasticus]